MGIRTLMARAVRRTTSVAAAAEAPAPHPASLEQTDAKAQLDVDAPTTVRAAFGPYRLSPTHRQIVALTGEGGRYGLQHVALYDAIPALAATDGCGLVILPMDATGEGKLPDVRAVLGGLAPERCRAPDVLIPTTVLQLLPIKLAKGSTDIELRLTRKGQIWTAVFTEVPYGATKSVSFEHLDAQFPDIWDIVKRGLGLKPQTTIDVDRLASIAKAMGTESVQMAFEDEKGVIALRGSGTQLDLAGVAVGMLMPITPATSAQPTE